MPIYSMKFFWEFKKYKQDKQEHLQRYKSTNLIKKHVGLVNLLNLDLLSRENHKVVTSI